jgi:hypothetical protein
MLMIRAVVVVRTREYFADCALHAGERRAQRMNIAMVRKNLRRTIAHEISIEEVRSMSRLTEPGWRPHPPPRFRISPKRD